MKRILPVAALLIAGLLRGEVLDRTVAVVGTRPITASEVEMQLLLEAMFNDEPPGLTPELRREALERLIEQRLIETDMTLAGLQAIEDRELDAPFAKLREQRFGGMAFEQALERYRLQVSDVRGFLRKQLQFTRYVQFRFRAGLQADQEALRAAYRQRFRGAPSPPPFESVEAELREPLLAERTEEMLNERVRQLRAETRVVFLDPIGPEREIVP